MAYRVEKERLDDFLKVISRGRRVYALEASERRSPAADGASGKRADYHLVSATEWIAGKHTLGAYRAVEPLKALVFRPLELVGFLDGKDSHAELQERIVFGVKNCDLSALQIHDHVFLKSDPVDPTYKEAREKTIIVSCDCTDCLDVCFCPAVGEQPHSKGGFDINISPVPVGYVVESGSPRGEALLKEASALLTPADQSVMKEVDCARAAMTRKVCDQADAVGVACGADYTKAIKASGDADFWDEFAKDCVECGACNLICCTCHCFLLADGQQDGREGRVKQWDSCLYRNFARVAGGANPRKHRAERLHNRFDKKFVFFPEILGRFACDGCGRCVEACTGKIDIRKVLKKAVDEL